jgi:hypothetical protein
LKDFANAVAEQIVPLDLLPPLGCHYAFADPQWEITVFASDTEVVGGERDGAVRPPRFTCDIRAVLDLFDTVEGIHWQSMPANPEDELGAHISVEGYCEGNSVWLRVLARPPRRFQVGRLARVYETSWEEVW